MTQAVQTATRSLPRRLVGLGGLAALIVCGAVEKGYALPKIPPARDGTIAIQQELDAARRAGTKKAYDLFIARHPRHPLTEIAKRERCRLISRVPD